MGLSDLGRLTSENRPQRGQFLPDLQAHSPAMGQKDGEKWTAAVDLQPTIPKPGRLLAPADLVRLTLIDSKLNPVQWADWCSLNGLKLPDRARPSFDRGSLAIAAAVDGLGVALETRRFAEVELAKGELVVIDGPSFQRIEREIHFLCYRRADRDSHRMTAFRDWLYAQAGAEPPDWP